MLNYPGIREIFRKIERNSQRTKRKTAKLLKNRAKFAKVCKSGRFSKPHKNWEKRRNYIEKELNMQNNAQLIENSKYYVKNKIYLWTEVSK